MWPDKKACEERGPFLISWPAVICVIKNGPWENEMARPVKNLAVAGVSWPNGKTYLKRVFLVLELSSHNASTCNQRTKDCVWSWTKIGSVLCLWTPVSLSVPENEMEGRYIYILYICHWGFSSVQLCCLMSSDVSWHMRDKLRPMPKHGSV